MCQCQAQLSVQGGPQRNAAVHLQGLRPAFILVAVLAVLHTLVGTNRQKLLRTVKLHRGVHSPDAACFILMNMSTTVELKTLFICFIMLNYTQS